MGEPFYVFPKSLLFALDDCVQHCHRLHIPSPKSELIIKLLPRINIVVLKALEPGHFCTFQREDRELTLYRFLPLVVIEDNINVFHVLIGITCSIIEFQLQWLLEGTWYGKICYPPCERTSYVIRTTSL